MFQQSVAVKIIDEACVGCRLCTQVCPSGALSMKGKLAVLDEPRCVGCMKCIEQCLPYGAIEMAMRESPPQLLGIPESDRDTPEVAELCASARLDPGQVICVCTGTTAGEVAAAVASGITEPEDITYATGVRALCGWLCLTPVTRLLDAAGVEIKRAASDTRLYPEGTKIAIWNIPDGVDEKYPEYRLKESLEAINAGEMNEPSPWFADIQPERKPG